MFDLMYAEVRRIVSAVMKLLDDLVQTQMWCLRACSEEGKEKKREFRGVRCDNKEVLHGPSAFPMRLLR